MRSFILVLLAIFLTSAGERRTQFVFTNVLAQIGLGYTFVYLLLSRKPAVQFAAAILILCGTWLFFARHPLPGPGFPHSEFGADEPVIMMKGFFAHWNKNANVAAAFDRWFLNLFPRPHEDPFLRNPGGYTTLNFIPSIATMLFGVLAGELLASRRSRGAKLLGLLVAGLAGLVVGPARRRQLLSDHQADLDSVVGAFLDGLDVLDAGRVLWSDRSWQVTGGGRSRLSWSA